MKSYSTETTRAAVLAFALLTSPLFAQQAPAARPDAATLARYDANKNGVLDPEEQAALEADRRRAATAAAPTSAAAAPASEEILSLSPFEVVSDTRGYFASNTMSGTRLNSKIEGVWKGVWKGSRRYRLGIGSGIGSPT